MKFNALVKKITAGLTATALGLSLTFTAVPVPKGEAISIIDIAGIAVSTAMLKSQVSKQIATFNNTEGGREDLYQQFRQEYGVNTDSTLNARMDRIMSNLTAAVGKVDSSIYDKPYKYFVSNDTSLNAACSYGHVMMVNTGAFNELATDDEIAAIVGHEMGHGQKDHVAKSNKKTVTKLAIAQLGAAAIGDASALGSVVANVVASVGLKNAVAHSTKKNETEADNLAWEYMLNTDYNIGACAAVMQRLAELYGDKSKSDLLNPSDHPDTGKRRDNYAKKLYEYSGKHASAKDGVVTVNGKTFMEVAAADNMSAAERSYFVLGNLAKAYHNGQNNGDVTVYNGTVYMGDQAIVTPAYDDEDAYTLAERLGALK